MRRNDSGEIQAHFFSIESVDAESIAEEAPPGQSGGQECGFGVWGLETLTCLVSQQKEVIRLRIHLPEPQNLKPETQPPLQPKLFIINPKP